MRTASASLTPVTLLFDPLELRIGMMRILSQMLVLASAFHLMVAACLDTNANRAKSPRFKITFIAMI